MIYIDILILVLVKYYIYITLHNPINGMMCNLLLWGLLWLVGMVLWRWLKSTLEKPATCPVGVPVPTSEIMGIWVPYFFWQSNHDTPQKMSHVWRDQGFSLVGSSLLLFGVTCAAPFLEIACIWRSATWCQVSNWTSINFHPSNALCSAKETHLSWCPSPLTTHQDESRYREFLDPWVVHVSEGLVFPHTTLWPSHWLHWPPVWCCGSSSLLCDHIKNHSIR